MSRRLYLGLMTGWHDVRWLSFVPQTSRNLVWPIYDSSSELIKLDLLFYVLVNHPPPPQWCTWWCLYIDIARLSLLPSWQIRIKTKLLHNITTRNACTAIARLPLLLSESATVVGIKFDPSWNSLSISRALPHNFSSLSGVVQSLPFIRASVCYQME